MPALPLPLPQPGRTPAAASRRARVSTTAAALRHVPACVRNNSNPKPGASRPRIAFLRARIPLALPGHKLGSVENLAVTQARAPRAPSRLAHAHAG